MRVDVGDGRNADARRLEHVHDLDADARANVARRRGVLPRHVGRDDGSDDAPILSANALALSPSRRQDKGGAPRLADGAGRHGVLLRLGPARNARLSIRHGTGNDRDAITRAFARRSARGQPGRPDRRRTTVHRVEGTTTRLLSGVTWARLYITSGRRHSLATRPASRPPLQLLLWRPDSDPPRSRCHGPARDGCRNSGHHHRTPCPSQ